MANRGWRTMHVTAVLIATALAVLAVPRPAPAARALESYARAPLAFEPNQGQAPADASFVARGAGYELLVGPSGARFVLGTARTLRDGSGEPAVIHMRLVDAKAVAPTASQAGSARVSYFVGSDPERWRSGIPTYGRLHAAGVYPGVDLVYYGNQRRLEYDFVVAPGADPRVIRLALEDPRPGAIPPAVDVDSAGTLVVRASGGAMRLPAPVAYQDLDGTGGRRSVSVRYALVRDGDAGRPRVAFEVGEYDTTRTLVIDPVVEYSAYLGGAQVDGASALAVASDGSVYVTGRTASSPFPHAINGKAAGYDAFVARLDPTGAVAWVTYLGGNGDDEGLGIVVDGLGRVSVVGTTASSDFPRRNARQTSSGGATDAFVTTLTAAGALVYSTYLGGEGADRGLGITADQNGFLYVTGDTASTAFPLSLSSSLQGGTDAFVAKLDPAASGAASLIFSRRLGGSALDEGRGVAVDAGGAVYVVGATTSADFPITLASAWPEAHRGGQDAFVAKLDSTGQSILYATFLGGVGDDVANGVAPWIVDGIVAVTGTTDSPTFPVKDTAYQFTKATLPDGSEPPDGRDAFVALVNTLNTLRKSLVYSTFLGGTGRDEGHAVTVTPDGHVYVTGFTESADFPVKDATATHAGASDAFVAKIDTEAAGDASLLFSTFVGGSGVDEGHGIGVDASGDVYVGGLTTSTDLPGLPGGAALSGPQDAFVTKLAHPDLIVTQFDAPDTAIQGEVVVVTVTVKNIGAVTAGPSTLRFFVRPTDKTLGPETPVEYNHDVATVPSLAPGSSHFTGAIQLRIPFHAAGPGSGPHYFSAMADGDNVVAEGVEDNNRLRRALLIRRDGPDLTLQALTATASRSWAGGSFQVTDTTGNIGNEVSDPSTTEFWLSRTTDTTGSVARIGSRSVAALQPLTSDQRTTTVTIPTTVPVGDYFILAIANAGRVRDEDFTNNVRTRAITIGPDLVIESLTSTDLGSGKLDLRDTTMNLYKVGAPASKTGFYLTTTPGLDTGVIARLGERSISSFSATTNRNKGKTTVTLPASLAPGAYYIVARADDKGTVPELVETNNTLAIAVQLGPDLVVAKPTVPSSAPRGATITVKNKVTNQGSASATASTVAFSLTTGSACNQNTRSLGTRPVSSLAPGLSSAQDTKLTLPADLTAGSYCVVVRADGGNVVTETNEANNTSSGKITVTVP